MIYQCTKNMLKSLKKEAEKKPDNLDNLYSWSVKLTKLNRRNLVYLMNDATKISVVLYGITLNEFKNFNVFAKDYISKVLLDCGIDQKIVYQYINHDINEVFCKSGSKRQLGIINNAVLDVEFNFDEDCENNLFQREISLIQNQSFFKNDNGDYITPEITMKNLLERTFSNSIVNFDIEMISQHMFNRDREGIIPLLNIKDGSIKVVNKFLDDYFLYKANNDFVFIDYGNFDFYNKFGLFSKSIYNMDFQMNIAKYGHGVGSIKRITDILNSFPEINQKWCDYQDEIKQEKVKFWLESLGLM
jgi:hypothetical protein